MTFKVKFVVAREDGERIIVTNITGCNHANEAKHKVTRFYTDVVRIISATPIYEE